MKIKVGDKLPSAELFYLDKENIVEKVDIFQPKFGDLKRVIF